jgi:hypothetical protein
MAALGAGPAVGRVDPDRPGGPGPATADLHGALDRTGAFRGADGLAGIVDPGSWSLVSDLAAGEAPRFARARRSVAPAGVGQWSAVGPSGNTSALNGHVLALTADSDLFVGGDFFNTLGAPEADNLARWDGSAYSGFGSNDPLGNTVRAIAVIGDDLYVGGTFQDAAGIAGADRIAKWDGSTSTWSALGNGLNAQVRALAVSGNTVYVAGDFTDADGIAAADYIAKWDGSWSALGSHNGNGALADQVHALAVSGSTVYAGGLFTNARGRPEADYVARFDGSWTALGSDGAGDGALSDIVYALLLDGSDLYVGGDFVNAGNAATADFVARWDGGSWAGLGSNGSGNGALDARVHALAKSGPDLYVGGHFLDGAGIPEADRVAMWDGGSWSALGSNGAGNGAIGDTVYALAVFDGDLYAGGVFFDAAGIPAADHLARFGLAPVYQPDGRVRIGTTGAFTGNDIYNANGNQQGVSSRGAPGTTLVFQLSLQNDAPTLGDRFTVSANGNVPVGYEVRYFKGTTEITNDVIAGTYQTPRLRPGRSFKIKVEVTVAANAPAGSKVTRKVTVTSVGDAAKLDVVKVTGRRS